MWNGSSWLRIGACDGSCKYSNETSDSGARKLVTSLVPADNGWYAVVGSLLYNAFSVTRLYSVDDKVICERL
jgi:hypothetical protein